VVRAPRVSSKVLGKATSGFERRSSTATLSIKNVKATQHKPLIRLPNAGLLAGFRYYSKTQFNFWVYPEYAYLSGLVSAIRRMGGAMILKQLFKESPIRSGLNFSGNKFFWFKAQISGNRPLFSRFATQKRKIFALEKNHDLFSDPAADLLMVAFYFWLDTRSEGRPSLEVIAFRVRPAAMRSLSSSRGTNFHCGEWFRRRCDRAKRNAQCLIARHDGFDPLAAWMDLQKRISI